MAFADCYYFDGPRKAFEQENPVPNIDEIYRLIEDQTNPLRKGGSIEKAMNRLVVGQDAAAEALDKLAKSMAGDSLEDLNEALLGGLQAQVLEASNQIQKLHRFDAATDVTETVGKLVESLTRNPLEQYLTGLTKTMLAAGIDAEDLHTPGFLAILEVIRENTPENQIDFAEPMLRLLVVYDIILVLEAKMKAFVEACYRSQHGDDWWSHMPSQLRGDCAAFKRDREAPGSEDHHPITYASLTNFEKVFEDTTVWQSEFEPHSNTSQDDFLAILEVVTERRNDVAHPRPMPDREFAMFVLNARWLVMAMEQPDETDGSLSEDDADEG